MTAGRPLAYRDLSRRQRRVVRRAARRGRRAQFPSELAAPLLDLTARRRRRSSRLLLAAVAVILASVAATGVLFLQVGADPLLAAPAVGLLVGGVVGVRSESRLRHAEQAAQLAAHQVTRRAPTATAVTGAPTPAAAGEPAGDAAQQRLARILAGAEVVAPRDPAAGRHPWD